MLRFLVLTFLGVLTTSCADNQNLPDTSRGIFETVSAPPLAVLTVEQQDEIDGLTLVALDATESRYDANFTSYKFEVRQSEAGKNKLLAGPAATSNNYATVLLPEGTYVINLTVMDSESEVASISETITVVGSSPKGWGPNQVNWSFSPSFTSGDETETFHRSNGGFPLGLAHALFETKTVSDSSLLGSSGGCGGMLNNAGNGIGIVTGVIGVGIAIAVPEAKVAEIGIKATASAANAVGASTKIAGGNKSGACVQAQIDGIMDQLAYQEEQILGLYKLINRDEEAFFKAMVEVQGEISQIEKKNYKDKLDVFANSLVVFMEAAALWEQDVPWMLTGTYPDGDQLPLDLLKIAASNYSDPACTVNKPGADCEDVPEDSGPVSKIDSIGSFFSYADLGQVAGLNRLGDCQYDCWQHVGPADGKEGNSFLDLYTTYSEELIDEVRLCTDPGTSTQCSYAVDNNVVPLFDQYNTAIAMQYLKSANALQKSHSMRQLINLYNYNRYVASLCSKQELEPGELGASQSCLDIQQEYNAKSNLQIKQIGPKLSVNGTFYKHNGNICGTSNIAGTPHQNAEAFTCAQQQLAMLYAQMFSVLYTNFLNFVITDGPVGAQAYPVTNVVFPAGMDNIEALNDALRNFNLRLDSDADGLPLLGARFDYEYEVGRGLPDGARTPIDLLTNVAGLQTAYNGANWTTDGALYQAYHISDAATCLQTLLDFNASGQADVKLEDIYPNYEDCPSIFALHDGTSVGNGFYDGITVQPYSFKVSPGGSATCKDECNSCQSGFDINYPDSFDTWYPGGQGLFSIDGGAEQCRGFCSGSMSNDVPDNTCGDYDFADTGYTDCTQCSDSANVAVFALSAPMGGNVRQCRSDKVTDVTTPGVAENKTLSCNTSVYYGKQHVNSLLVNAVPAAPGDGAVASFAQMIDNGEYSVRPSLPASDWNNFTPDGNPVNGDNGSWSDSCENPTFSGYAGNHSSPPTLEASCARSDGTKIVSKATCDSGRWGNDEGQLFCETGGTVTAFSSSDVTCSNTGLGGDPSPFYYKQCFCPPGGNQLGWLRTDKKSEFEAKLTYLSCGAFAEFRRPSVAYEYDTSPGRNTLGYDDNDNDYPPTFFRENPTREKETYERDIGVPDLSSSGLGVKFVVSFANVNLQCNASDNIQLDIIDWGGNFNCESDADFRNNGPSNVDWVNPQASTSRTDTCLEFAAAPKIRNADNSKTVNYNLTLRPRNALKSSASADDKSGPGIPIDLVMQCSDGTDSGYAECEDQSMCMHMVSFADAGADVPGPERDEAMAKRGYVCKNLKDAAGKTRDTSNEAQMSCELADGRTVTMSLAGYVDRVPLVSDDRAKLTVVLD